MMIAIQILIVVLALFVLAWFTWRIYSRRASLPCPSWLAWLVEMENPFAGTYNSGSIVQTLALEPGMRILDAGCGPGRVTIPLAKAVGSEGRVVAVDIQSGMLKRAEAKAKAAGLANIDFRELAMGRDTLGADQFDRALLVTVLGEIPDRQSVLREIHRALKRDGILSITEIVFDPHYQRRASILKLADSAGFREKAFFGNRLAFTIHLEKSTSQVTE